MITHSLTIDRRTFESRTGWTLEPEGACKGAICIPVDLPDGSDLPLDRIAEQMGLPLVHDADHGIWALGPESIGSRALTTAVAANLTLDDLSGRPFELASLRGKKVLLIAWSPY